MEIKTGGGFYTPKTDEEAITVEGNDDENDLDNNQTQ